MKRYIGIDPGKTGAAACLTFEDSVELSVDYICFNHRETTNKKVLSLLTNEWAGARQCVLEKVHSSPQMGVASSFTFGKTAGAIEVLVDLAYPLVWTYVSPQKWQRKLGCMTKGNKNITRYLAKALFSEMRDQVTHRNADALLIATYAAVVDGHLNGDDVKIRNEKILELR